MSKPITIMVCTPLIAVTLSFEGLAQGAAAPTDDPFAELARETRPLATRWEVDYSGTLEGSLGYVSQDNFMFGQYNGLYDKGAVLIGNIDWRGWNLSGNRYWSVEASDLGLETRRALLEWGQAGSFRLGLLMNNQVQVKNNTARTPFVGVGSSRLTLPGDWVTGANTSDWTALEAALQQFDRKLKRQEYGIFFDTAIAGGWSIASSLTTEHKDGTTDLGGAIFVDGSNPHAVLMPQPIDQQTTQFDLGLNYQGRATQWNIAYYFSHFENQEDGLDWQNPYGTSDASTSVISSVVDYPNGFGGMAVAPDNQFHRLRLNGNYIFSPKWRLQVDGSYGRALQDEGFRQYTVNPALNVYSPVPRENLNASADTATAFGSLQYRPTRKLSLEGRYRLYDRRNDGPRNGYIYVRGDGADQPESKYANYNTTHDTRKQVGAIEGSYRLPKRSKFILEYAHERIDRRNAPVEHTGENIFRGQFNTAAWQPLQARFELLYGDLNADTYDWAQDYYALFDAELINQTPDTQRYINHPLASQYHVANRERLLSKVDLNYVPAQSWSLALNMLWRRDDYDKSTLGLTDEYWDSYVLSASYLATDSLNLTGYLNYNRYKSSQSSRSFRGGAEKNAFVTTPPLPQASDSSRDWDVDSDDTVAAVGVVLKWQALERLEFDFDYSYVDTRGEHDFKTYGADDIQTAPLPDRRTRQHQFQINGGWHLRDDLSLNLDYRLWVFDSDNWAIDDVQPNTISKVLTFGEESADENVHYLGISISYRLR